MGFYGLDDDEWEALFRRLPEVTPENSCLRGIRFDERAVAEMIKRENRQAEVLRKRFLKVIAKSLHRPLPPLTESGSQA